MNGWEAVAAADTAPNVVGGLQSHGKHLTDTWSAVGK